MLFDELRLSLGFQLCTFEQRHRLPDFIKLDIFCLGFLSIGLSSLFNEAVNFFWMNISPFYLLESALGTLKIILKRSNLSFLIEHVFRIVIKGSI